MPQHCAVASWPDVDRGLVCGTCKVLVANIDRRYGGTCDAYCSAVGSVCVGASEQVGDTCEVQREVSCFQQMGRTSDALCECAAQACPVFAWPDLDHCQVCGSCRVLVNNFKRRYGGSCVRYCRAVGSTCLGAWEGVGDSCEVKHEAGCFEIVDSSVAICECAPPRAGAELSFQQLEQQWRDRDEEMCVLHQYRVSKGVQAPEKYEGIAIGWVILMLVITAAGSGLAVGLCLVTFRKKALPAAGSSSLQGRQDSAIVVGMPISEAAAENIQMDNHVTVGAPTIHPDP